MASKPLSIVDRFLAGQSVLVIGNYASHNEIVIRKALKKALKEADSLRAQLRSADSINSFAGGRK